MTISTFDAQSFISKKLHNLLFIEEFVFSKNKFTPPQESEIELADAIVMMGDVLLIYQIKERAAEFSRDAESERKWFKEKVLGRATKQVRDTLRYLETYSEVLVPNERGHVFNLAKKAYSEILKIVVYLPSKNLPDDCRHIHHYVSKSAGFIHVVNAHDYLEIAKTLRVPEEVVRYFRYREEVITKYATQCALLPEPCMAGHFISGNLDEPPSVESARYLYRLKQDDEEWNLAPFMRGLHDHLSVPGVSDDYYQILIELAKLPRSMWRCVKERLRLCIEKVRADKYTMPYRIVYPRTNCGFVFIPVHSDVARNPNWNKTKLLAIQNFTEAHKYDQRLSRCVGILIYKDGDYFCIDWCLISGDWVEDINFEKRLKENFPFRSVKESDVRGYVFLEDDINRDGS